MAWSINTVKYLTLWLCLLTLSSNLHCGYVYWHCQVGITFQSSATWKKHIDDIYKKACFRLLLLRPVKHLLDRYSLIHIYFAFIRPVLEYVDVVWGNCTKKESDLLESVQIETGWIITVLDVIPLDKKIIPRIGVGNTRK